MKTWSSDLRRKVVEAYQSGRSGSYLETAKMFGVGSASVSRWLRMERERPDVKQKQQLVPKLCPDDIVVMDNLNAHKNTKVVETIEAAGVQVLFTPPYSPEFNPIEKA